MSFHARFIEIVRQAVRELLRNNLRTLLTMFGIGW